MISIITPVRNGAGFIEECIRSVIAQADGVEIEHIIIDGASSDETVAVIQDFARVHDHIRWLSEPDAGQSDAMNKAICLARGQLLGILNVDDFYQPNTLKRVAHLCRTTHLPVPSLLIGNCNMWDERGNLLTVNRPHPLRRLDLLIPDNSHRLPLNPSQYFYHSGVHQMIGLYDVDEHYAMDIDFFVRALAVVHVIYVDETWGNYRLIPGTKTYHDIATGQAGQRFERLLQKHRSRLALQQRIELLFRWSCRRLCDVARRHRSMAIATVIQLTRRARRRRTRRESST